MEKLTMSVSEMAKLLGVGTPTAYEIARREGFPSIRISPRRIIIPVKAFEKWLEDSAENRLEINPIGR